MHDFEDRREDLLEQVAGDVRQKKYAALRELLLELEPADIAQLLEELEEDMLPILFRLLPKEPAADVFVELEAESQELLIRSFSNTELKEVLD